MARLVDTCFVIGFNFTHTSEADRSMVALNEEVQSKIYQRSEEAGLHSLVILSTCNRTELYGQGDGSAIKNLIHLYFEIAAVPEKFHANLHVQTGEKAIQHIFLVASGLASQIIGDLEILGQFKAAFKSAKTHGMLGGFFERMLNTCIQSAKEIRHETRITSGTVSLSYATAKILHNFNSAPDSKILVVGAGKFGTSIVRDVRHFMPEARLFITNRTLEKAEKVAAIFHGEAIPFDAYAARLNEFDVIITAIGNTEKYLITPTDLIPEKSRILIDMSVPKAIDKAVAQMEGIRLVNIDDASVVINQSLETRKSDLPTAFAIIEKYMEQFIAWSITFEKRDIIASWKNILVNMINKCPILGQYEPKEQRMMVKKSMAEFGIFLKNNPAIGKDAEDIISYFLKNHASIFEYYQGVHAPQFEYTNLNG